MLFIKDFIKRIGIDETYIEIISEIIMLAIVLILSFIFFIIANMILNKIGKLAEKRKKSKWTKHFRKNKLYKRINSLIIPVVIINTAHLFLSIGGLLTKLAVTYFLLIIALIVRSFFDSLNDIYMQYEISRSRPIKGLLQVVMIIVYIIIGIIIIANLINEKPLVLLSGVGAVAAVFSFVFKDMILGFVAGLQLTSNDMLRIGDWISVSKSDVEGIVKDISLISIKIECFDKSYATIPAYNLISDSFKNYRGMQELGARRLKRSINIDVNSIKFSTKEDIEKYKKIKAIRSYILEKEEDIAKHNDLNKVNKMPALAAINGRSLTNLGTFRAYLLNYLKNHANVRKDLTIVVRQLPASYDGLSLEVYCFIDKINFDEFEVVQSDIFDHIYAVIDEFDLKVYQVAIIRGN